MATRSFSGCSSSQRATTSSRRADWSRTLTDHTLAPSGHYVVQRALDAAAAGGGTDEVFTVGDHHNIRIQRASATNI